MTQLIAAIALTPNATKTLQPICSNIGAQLWIPESITNIAQAQTYRGDLKTHVASLWETQAAIVFCLATGAVVRLIAPLLQHKSTDPAVIVVDETGKFVISLCGGHQGGADKLTTLIAQLIGATPVLTGVSASLGLPAVDMLGVPFGWRRGGGDWTGVSAVVARGESVQVIQEAGSNLWQKAYSFKDSPTPQAKIYITARNVDKLDYPQIQWHPQVLWVGIGCERGTTKETIAKAITKVFLEYKLAESAIAAIATIDIKADEVGLLELCQERDLPLITFTKEVLSAVTVPNPSNIVKSEVGTPSVAEAAALSASSSQTLLVTKQIFKSVGAVTIAIAQSKQEYTGRTGKLLLIGTGPGQLDQITPAAKIAIASADVVIGYSLYIDLIAPLLQPEQIIEAMPITQERQRAERAIELANWGLTVAVVSSGDSGIYGMAGIVMEQLQAANWDGKTPSVQLFPGISALQAAASRVGTPLMHDFCAISLSDLLTPWETIEKRLIAAAQADFITALYNPKSQTRTQQLATATAIFLQYRDPNTPVAIVRSAYRPDEQITLTTLDKLLDTNVDMLTTVLIGNQTTRTHNNWMITPRGYLGFGDSVASVKL
ncbi:precorrin-3B C(17)-methyltransferase [Synechocystis sp. PCC 7509]|uniref:precorrin-3B C(17)-methyltransferase n=1 Tax=Synechocystis sp. PCC 7509 TaxID=927677 RepID=UPI0002AB9D5D|nr:precorrin-3B C(17)-methyltransferase [Synechocystis sp. PCC 7509]